jgi:hypothetical protein
MNLHEIKANAPVGATGYYEYGKGKIRYIRKTPKNYFYQNTHEGKWWEIPTTMLRFIKDDYKPL